MAIVTFWNNSREQTGKTLTAVAVATQMAIQHNFKVLLLSTSFNDSTVRNCYWINKIQNKLKLYPNDSNIAVENGLKGLSKLIKSNKVQPNIITDYTRVIFKDRLEILVGSPDSNSVNDINIEYEEAEESMPELIKIANQYYDMVLVDLSSYLNSKTRTEILNLSNLNVFVVTQRLSSLNNLKKLKENNKELLSPKNITVIGKYIQGTKYSVKNINRLFGIKEELYLVPFNKLYFDAAEEAQVPDLFLKLRKMTDKNDDNYFFISETLILTNKIVNKIKDLQMKMR